MSRKGLLQEGTLFGSYRVEALLGRGGMGEVYRVRHTILDTDFALKILDPAIAESEESFVKRFIREAQLAANILNEHLAHVVKAGRDEATGLYYLVMEYLGGGSLRERLEKRGAFSVQEALDVVSAVAQALVAAEKAGVVHRDIKPDNIMFASDGTAKLVDLGLAKARLSANAATMTMEGATMGTPAYSAPEQLLDSASVTFRSDIYSLGVVLYELLTGEVPNKSATPIQHLARAIKRIPLPDVRKTSRVPDGVAELVADMTNPDPAMRPATAGEVVTRIASSGVALRRRVRSNPVRFGVRMKRFVRKTWRFFAIAAVVALAASVAYYAGRFNGFRAPAALEDIPKPGTTPLSREEIAQVFGNAAQTAESGTNSQWRIYLDESASKTDASHPVRMAAAQICAGGRGEFLNSSFGPETRGLAERADVIVSLPRSESDGESSPIYTKAGYAYLDRLVAQGRTLAIIVYDTGPSELAEHYGIEMEWPAMGGNVHILGAVKCGKGLAAAIWTRRHERLRTAQEKSEMTLRIKDILLAACKSSSVGARELPPLTADDNDGLYMYSLRFGNASYGINQFFATKHFLPHAEKLAQWCRSIEDFLAGRCGFPRQTLVHWSETENPSLIPFDVVQEKPRDLIRYRAFNFSELAAMTPYECGKENHAFCGDDDYIVEFLLEVGDSEYRGLSSKIDKEMEEGGLKSFETVEAFLLRGRPELIKKIYDLRQGLMSPKDPIDRMDVAKRLSNRAAIVCAVLEEDRMADFRRDDPGVSWAKVHPDVMAVLPESLLQRIGGTDATPRTAKVGDFIWHYTLERGEAVLWRGMDATSGEPCIEPLPAGKLIVPAEINGHRVVAFGPLAFYGCKDMTEIVLPETLDRIDARSFMHCSSLKSIALPPSVRSIGLWAFNHCSSLEKVDLGLCRHLERGFGVFAFCSNLRQVEPGWGNMEFKWKDGRLYSRNLRTLVGVPQKGGMKAYTRMRNLRTETIKDEIEEVGPFAFYGSPAGRITLPASLKRIGEGAFMNCAQLRELVFEGDAPEIEKGEIPVFKGTNPTMTIIATENAKGWNNGEGAVATQWPVTEDEKRKLVFTK